MSLKVKRTTRALSLTAVAVLALALVGTASAGTTTYSSIQKSKWSSCTVCAGANGSGPSASYSQTIYVSSPSMTGASSKFSIGGSTPYSNALWWKQLGA